MLSSFQHLDISFISASRQPGLRFICGQCDWELEQYYIPVFHAKQLTSDNLWNKPILKQRKLLAFVSKWTWNRRKRNFHGQKEEFKKTRNESIQCSSSLSRRNSLQTVLFKDYWLNTGSIWAENCIILKTERRYSTVWNAKKKLCF